MSPYTLDENDCIVHHQPNSENQTQERDCIYREAEYRKEHKRADQCDRHGQHWNQSSAPVLEKDVDYDDHKQDGDQESLNDLLYALCDRTRRVKRYDVIHILREALLRLGHHLLDTGRGVNRIGTGQLVQRDDGPWLPIKAAKLSIGLSAQLHAGHIPDPHNTAIRRFADHDLPEFLRRGQTALRTD